MIAVNHGDDEAEIVGRASAGAFHEPRCIAERPSTLQAEADVSGGWRIEIQFLFMARRHIISILSRMRCSYQASITPDHLPARCPVRFTATAFASRLHTSRYRCPYFMASRAKSPKMALSVERSSSLAAQKNISDQFSRANTVRRNFMHRKVRATPDSSTKHYRAESRRH